MPEKRITYLGTIDTSGVGAIALPPNLDSADPAVIRAAIEQAEREKAEETQRLRATFLGEKVDDHE